LWEWVRLEQVKKDEYGKALPSQKSINKIGRNVNDIRWKWFFGVAFKVNPILFTSLRAQLA
jgi:hypothetical protein